MCNGKGAYSSDIMSAGLTPEQLAQIAMIRGPAARMALMRQVAGANPPPAENPMDAMAKRRNVTAKAWSTPPPRGPITPSPRPSPGLPPRGPIAPSPDPPPGPPPGSPAGPPIGKPPPMPTPRFGWNGGTPPQAMQPGQGGWNWGIPNSGAGEFGNQTQMDWQASFDPAAKAYITHILGSYLMPQGLAGKVDWNDAVASIGNLSGIPYNPSFWGGK